MAICDDDWMGKKRPALYVPAQSSFCYYVIKADVENWMQQDGVWTKVLKRILCMLSISALIVGGFLILLNMIFK